MTKIILFISFLLLIFKSQLYGQWYPNPEAVISYSSDTSNFRTYYYPNEKDKLGELIYDDEKLISATYYYKNGDEVPNSSFKNGNGKLNSFGYGVYPKKSKKNGCYGNFTNGLPDGKFQCYLKDKLVSEYSYNKGMANGNCKRYTTKGVLTEESNYKNDSLDGVYRMYSDKSEILLECYYKDNKLHGKWKSYFFGILIEEKNYKEGLLDGDLILYNNDGSISKTEFYIQGKKRRKKK